MTSFCLTAFPWTPTPETIILELGASTCEFGGHNFTRSKEQTPWDGVSE